MTPPTVLLDRTFLGALVDPGHDGHADARTCYSRLLDEYEANRVRLRARSDVLHDVERDVHHDLLAPVEPISVAKQFRRQAARLGDAYEPDVAVTLVVMRRESIERIATFDPFYDTIDVVVER
jgi:predicted nucleic acid-binding protein